MIKKQKKTSIIIIIIINVLIKVTLNEYAAGALYRVSGRR